MSAVAMVLRSASQIAWWFAIGTAAAIATAAIQGCGGGAMAVKPILTGSCTVARTACQLINSACGVVDATTGGEEP